MEKDYGQYDTLFGELFERLFPEMVYNGPMDEQKEFFCLLQEEGSKLVYDMYRVMCEDAKLPCLNKKEDFEVNIFERGGINLLQIAFSQYGVDDTILRAYLLFMEDYDGNIVKKCFVIKRFSDKRVFNTYITPNGELQIGNELTENLGNMENEFWNLVDDYVKLIILDKRTEEKGKKKREKENLNLEDDKKTDKEKWSRDWAHFDWENVNKKVAEMDEELEVHDKGQIDLGITVDEVREYSQWLKENSPLDYYRALMYVDLKRVGIPEYYIEFWQLYPDKLLQLLNISEK